MESGAWARAEAESKEGWDLLQLKFACGLARDLLAKRPSVQRECLMDQAIKAAINNHSGIKRVTSQSSGNLAVCRASACLFLIPCLRRRQLGVAALWSAPAAAARCG